MLTGLEVLLKSGGKILRGRRAGLVMHPASVDSRRRLASDLLTGGVDFKIAALFGPQHGILGQTQDNMIEWEGFSDPHTGLPVYSLYGEARKPTARMLNGLDCMVVDLQDVGTRVYTFASTLFLVMEACSEAGIDVVALDRPNPIGGADFEGGLLRPEFKSFVGMMRTPMRHGMTMGELATMYRDVEGLSCGLKVVKMEGWRRGMWFDETGLPWVLPSPNMPTLDTAAVYPGMVMLEGTSLSEGRGTTRPFETLGAPWIDARALADALNDGQIAGAYFRPANFQPTFHKWASQVCGGVQIHVTDRATFRSVFAMLRIFEEIFRRWRDKFEWKQPPYEYVHNRLPIDVIAGGDEMRTALEAGRPASEIFDKWRAECESFQKTAAGYFLYD